MHPLFPVDCGWTDWTDGWKNRSRQDSNHVPLISQSFFYHKALASNIKGEVDKIGRANIDNTEEPGMRADEVHVGQPPPPPDLVVSGSSVGITVYDQPLRLSGTLS